MLFFFPRGVLGENLNLIESVSEVFLPTFSYFGESSCMFDLRFNLVSMFLR